MGKEGGYKTTPTNTHRYVKQDKIPSNWEPQRMRDVPSFPIKLQSYLKYRRKKNILRTYMRVRGQTSG